MALGFFQRWLQHAEKSKLRVDAFRLLSVLIKDEALARLRLEAELVEALFPEAREDCRKLSAGIDQLTPALGRVASVLQPR